MISADFSGVLPKGSEVPKEMLSVRVTDEGVWKFKVNFSSLSIMQECWRKAQYSLVRKLRTQLESPATLFGSAIHKALEVYYSGKRTERIIPPKYRETMEMIGCGRWESEWGEFLVFSAAAAFVTKAKPLSALSDDNKRSIPTGVWMLTHYFEKYLTDEYVVLEDEKGPIVERSFSLPMLDSPTMTIDLFGTIDAVMKNEISGLIVGVDHKTSSSLYDFYSMCKPNHQYSFYVEGIRRVLGFETESFLINALQVKPPPKTARGSPPDFARQITTRTEEDFSELKDAVTLACATFRANTEADTWPITSPGPCQKYGGCQFLDVCAAPNSLRENIIKARYAAI